MKTTGNIETDIMVVALIILSYSLMGLCVIKMGKKK